MNQTIAVPYYVPKGETFTQSLQVAPARVVKTTAKHILGSRTTGKTSNSGARLADTPYKFREDNGILPELRPFFNRHAMGESFDSEHYQELRREFISADVNLHTASNRCIAKLQHDAVTRYALAYEAINSELEKRR